MKRGGNFQTINADRRWRKIILGSGSGVAKARRARGVCRKFCFARKQKFWEGQEAGRWEEVEESLGFVSHYKWLAS